MPMLTELQVINQCLATLGESPLNMVDPDHPYVPPAQDALRVAMTQELGKGWWFNTDYNELLPDPVTGFVYYPGDAITVDTGGNVYVQRDRRMYDRANSTFVIGTSIPVKIVREIPFENLPMLANQLVASRAVMDFQQSFDGDSTRYGKLKDIYNQNFITIKAEETRQQKANMMDSVTVRQKFMRVRPTIQNAYVYGYGPGGIRNIGV